MIKDIEITARKMWKQLDGQLVELLAYNGQLPGPTFYVHEGDRVRIHFTNALAEPTNLHLHGMHMPPEVDDPHRVVAPGESCIYEFDVPVGAAGTYWYHPHVHGEVARQLAEGLAGAFVVLGPDDARAPLAEVREHVLVLQDLDLEDGKVRARTPMQMHDGREGDLVLVSGERTPMFDIPDGVTRIRLVNASSARFYDVHADGGELVLLGLDAAMLGEAVAVEHVLLPPGQRADVLIRARAAGRVELRHRPYRRGARQRPLPDGGLLASFAMGAPAASELPVLRPIERLDASTAVTSRVFEYGGTGALRMLLALVRRKRYGAGEGNQGPVRFWLNGKEFEPGRIDVEAQLGTTEIWELRNPTMMDHPFHLHIYPFQVLDIDGVAPAFPAWQDVVNVPAKKTVRIVVPFRDFAGVTMFHCHILEHEDNGMMAHLRVVDPERPHEAHASCG